MLHDAKQLHIKLDAIDAIETKDPAPHEEFNFRYKNVNFDVHAFFPIWKFIGNSVEITSAKLPQLQLTHNGNMVVSKVGYKKLFQYIKKQKSINHAYLEPAASAFILILNIYRDLTRLLMENFDRRPRVRMQELLDLQSFIIDRNFKAQTFVSLVTEYDILEQVHMCGSYLALLFSDASLLDIFQLTPLFQEDYQYTFTFHVWAGFNFKIRRKPMQLVFEKTPLSTFLQEIQCSEITLDSSQAKNLLIDEDQNTYHMHGEVDIFNASVHIDEYFNFTLEYKDKISNKELDIFIVLSEKHFRIKLEIDTNKSWTLTSRKAIIHHISNEKLNDVIRVKLSLEIVQTLATRNSNDFLLIGAGRISKDGTLSNGALTVLKIQNLQAP